MLLKDLLKVVSVLNSVEVCGNGINKIYEDFAHAFREISEDKLDSRVTLLGIRDEECIYVLIDGEEDD